MLTTKYKMQACFCGVDRMRCWPQSRKIKLASAVSTACGVDRKLTMLVSMRFWPHAVSTASIYIYIYIYMYIYVYMSVRCRPHAVLTAEYVYIYIYIYIWCDRMRFWPQSIYIYSRCGVTACGFDRRKRTCVQMQFVFVFFCFAMLLVLFNSFVTCYNVL